MEAAALNPPLQPLDEQACAGWGLRPIHHPPQALQPSVTWQPGGTLLLPGVAEGLAGLRVALLGDVNSPALSSPLWNKVCFFHGMSIC